MRPAASCAMPKAFSAPPGASMSRPDPRHLDLDPREASFVQKPYPAYHEIRARSPFFFWEQYGMWCAASHRLVSALLRDRRFGRQILHVMDRSELGWPEPP